MWVYAFSSFCAAQEICSVFVYLDVLHFLHFVLQKKFVLYLCTWMFYFSSFCAAEEICSVFVYLDVLLFLHFVLQKKFVLYLCTWMFYFFFILCCRRNLFCICVLGCAAFSSFCAAQEICSVLVFLDVLLFLHFVLHKKFVLCLCSWMCCFFSFCAAEEICSVVFCILYIMLDEGRKLFYNLMTSSGSFFYLPRLGKRSQMYFWDHANDLVLSQSK